MDLKLNKLSRILGLEIINFDLKKETLDIPEKVRRKIKKFLSEPRKKSENTHRPRVEKQRENDYWSYEEDSRSRRYAYLINKENKALRDLIMRIQPNERRKLTSYLENLSKNIPVYSIWANYSKDRNDYLEIGKSDWFESLLEEVGNS